MKNATAQIPCCVTNTLNISTGLNPVTSTFGAFGTADPKWQVTALSTNAMSRWGYTAASFPFAGRIVTPQAGWWNPGTPRWISFLNASAYPTDVAAGVLTMTLTRVFTVCKAGNFRFTACIGADNWKQSITFAGSANLSTDGVTPGMGLCSLCHNITDIRYLTPGTYTINITVANWDVTMPVNGHGLFLDGTVSTTDGSLVAENSAACANYACLSVSGSSCICVGGTSTLIGTPSGGTWTSSNTSVAGVSAAGVVTGNSVGTATITYTRGCDNTTYPVTVYGINPGVISGPLACAGETIHMTTTGHIGGTWSVISDGGSGTTINAITGDVICGNALTNRNVTIRYTLSSPCCGTHFVDYTFTVYAKPVINFTGVANACEYMPYRITAIISSVNPGMNYSWSSGGMSFGSTASTSATVDVLKLAGASLRSECETITVTDAVGCTSTATYCTDIEFPPIAGIITGPISSCEDVAPYMHITGNNIPGTWSVDLPAGISGITITSSGALQCLPGSITCPTAVTVKYTVSNSCGTDVASYPFTFYNVPSAAPYYTPNPYCSGDAPLQLNSGYTLCASESIGWTGTSGFTSGLLNPIVPPLFTTMGSSYMYNFTVDNGVCPLATFPLVVDVYPLPVSGTITGSDGCSGGTITMSTDGDAGGTWFMIDAGGTSTSIDPITGVVTCGTVTSATTIQIGYTATSTHCPSSTSVHSFIIHPLPTCTLSHSGSLCAGGFVTFEVHTVPNAIIGYHGYPISTFGGTTHLGYADASGNFTITYSAVLPTMTFVIDFVKDPITGCINFVDMSDVVNILAISNECACSAYSGGATVDLTTFAGPVTISSSSVPPGIYYMTGTVNISGTVNMTDCIIIINGGSFIVDPGAKLELNHSHLFGCHTMWGGIILDVSSSAQGQIELTNNTLIEDADIAIQANFPITPSRYTAGTPGDEIIKSNGAIFNRNQSNIRISNYRDASIGFVSSLTGYDYPLVTNPSYPFVIQNTVFTSRNLDNFNTGSTMMTGWPYAWPGATGVNGLKTPWTAPNPYSAPFNIDNPMACPTGAYVPAPTYLGDYPNYGIMIAGLGHTISTGGYDKYAGSVIGTLKTTSSNDELNLFDNLYLGIYSENSNVTSRNGVYMHTRTASSPRPLPTGSGIYAKGTTGSSIKDKLYVYGSDITGLPGHGGTTTQSANYFYDCNIGVETKNMYYVKGEFAEMYNEHVPTNFISGNYGYKMKAEDYYDVQINYNKICNITNGIQYESDATSVTNMAGQISVNNNQLQATSGLGILPIMGEYMIHPIKITNISGISGAPYSGSQINTNNNVIDLSYNGIQIGGYSNGQIVTSNDNNITLSQDVTTTAMTIAQVGIQHTGVYPAYIQGNTVKGPGYNVPATAHHTGGTAYSTPVIEGIQVNNASGSTASYVGCNTVRDINTGFHFSGTNNLKWINNTMNSNAYGYVQSGVIGNQLSFTQVSNNVWLPATTFWNSSTPNYQTYTTSSGAPGLSKLFVNNGTSTKPVVHGSEIGTPYVNGANVVVSGATSIMCPTPATSTVLYKSAGTSEEGIAAFENGQYYTLYPNPTRGSIVISQSTPTDGKAHMRVLNVVGSVVVEKDIEFVGGKSEVNIVDVVTGIYIIELADAAGNRTTTKIVVEK